MGSVMGEQVGAWGEGGTPSAMGLRSRGAFGEEPFISQAYGDAGTIQARRASRRFSMKALSSRVEQVCF